MATTALMSVGLMRPVETFVLKWMWFDSDFSARKKQVQILSENKYTQNNQSLNNSHNRMTNSMGSHSKIIKHIRKQDTMNKNKKKNNKNFPKAL